ncbi:unnamed protein product [Musa acuminata subsp. malaccensis]|uniref:(wild Malaysian banana) hypothetical protein n=1 Tax=Musa acuminata subsp. malaccensis TaxID=214687 RepID=A0A8D7F5B8_MUSAM|nr:unnamed protein product [Musa acuminata subsp. malaccensis]
MDTESVYTQRVVVEAGHDSHTWRKLTGDNFSSHASYADLRQRSVTDMGSVSRTDKKIVEGEFCYMYRNPLQDNPAYSVVKYHFVNEDDTVPQKIVVQKSSPGGIHFQRGEPRQREDVYACILTCGGLCPGLNTVIKDVVCRLSYMYGVKMIVGIQGGYRGFYARNTIPLTPKSVNDIHKRGGTILGTSRGGHDAIKIVDNIQDINQKLIYRWFLFPPVYIIGGDGTQKGAAGIRRRGLKLAVAGTPKTTDNDIAVIDKSFGFDTAVEEAQRAINAAHVEAEKAWRMV